MLLGKGKRLFAGGAPPSGLGLEEARSFDTGVVLQRYTPAGRPTYGSFLNRNPPKVELERRRRIEQGVPDA